MDRRNARSAGVVARDGTLGGGGLMPRTSTIEAVTPERVRSAIAAFLGVEPDDIDATTPLTAYGIDSLGALQLVAELEDRCGRPLPESLLTDCPDLEQIVEVVS